jgi:Tfp pilus assembly protein PilF
VRRTDEATSFLKEALRREPDFPEAQIDLALIDLQNNQLDAASNRITRALELYPNYDVALLTAARLCEQKEDVSGVAEYYKRAIADAGDSKLAMTVATRLEKLGFMENASEYYRWAAQSPRVDPDTRAEASRRLRR